MSSMNLSTVTFTFIPSSSRDEPDRVAQTSIWPFSSMLGLTVLTFPVSTVAPPCPNGVTLTACPRATSGYSDSSMLNLTSKLLSSITVQNGLPSVTSQVFWDMLATVPEIGALRQVAS